jgi:hypothetical protein
MMAEGNDRAKLRREKARDHEQDVPFKGTSPVTDFLPLDSTLGSWFSYEFVNGLFHDEVRALMIQSPLKNPSAGYQVFIT